jgi:hypothetical protein
LVRGSEVRIEGFDNAQENPKKGFFIMLFSFLWEEEEEEEEEEEANEENVTEDETHRDAISPPLSHSLLALCVSRIKTDKNGSAKRRVKVRTLL